MRSDGKISTNFILFLLLMGALVFKVFNQTLTLKGPPTASVGSVSPNVEPSPILNKYETQTPQSLSSPVVENEAETETLKKKLEEARKACSAGEVDACSLGLVLVSRLGQYDLQAGFKKAVCLKGEFVANECLLYGRSMQETEVSFFRTQCAARNIKACLMYAGSQMKAGKVDDANKILTFACYGGASDACLILGEALSENVLTKAEEGCRTSQNNSCLIVGGAKLKQGATAAAMKYFTIMCNKLDPIGCQSLGELFSDAEVSEASQQCLIQRRASSCLPAGVAEMKRNRNEKAKTLFQFACKLGVKYGCILEKSRLLSL